MCHRLLLLVEVKKNGRFFMAVRITSIGYRDDSPELHCVSRWPFATAIFMYEYRIVDVLLFD